MRDYTCKKRGYISRAILKQKSLRNHITEGLVPQTGLEPVRPCGHRILSPACLPVPPPGHGVGKKKDPNQRFQPSQ